MISDISALLPGQAAPDLAAPLLGGGVWRLHEQTPRAFQLIVVYRGHHCALCRRALEAWNPHIGTLAKLGVDALFVSADTQARAQASRDEWDIGNLTLAYGWSLAQARAWGLYVSEAIKEAEPAQFLEPGLFVLDPDFMVWSVNVQSSPFGRPHAADMVAAFELILEKDLPHRGAVAFVEDRGAELQVDLEDAAGG